MNPAVWVAAFLVLVALEVFTAGTLVAAPFALGAAAAFVASLLGAGTGVQVVVFAVVSGLSLLLLRPLARRFEGPTAALGATRLNGATGTVVETVTPDGAGIVRIEREEWRAVTADGIGLVAGSSCVVVDVRGTHVIVTGGDAKHVR